MKTVNVYYEEVSLYILIHFYYIVDHKMLIISNLESQIFDRENAEPLEMIIGFASKFAQMFYYVQNIKSYQGFSVYTLQAKLLHKNMLIS